MEDVSPLTANPLPSDLNEREQEREDHQTDNKLERFWAQVKQADLVDPFMRVGTLVLSLALIFVLVWVMRSFYSRTSLQDNVQDGGGILGAPELTPTPISEISVLPLLVLSEQTDTDGIRRNSGMHTTIPTRARINVIEYTVETGDSVFGIADKFNLRPETILWANTASLNDNPHKLQVGQELNIMPVDGTYHKWRQGENLRKVAEYYGVDAVVIIEWPGNHFDLFENDIDTLSIEPGAMLIVPGGERDMIDYGPPRIPRDDPAVARTYGPGHCGTLSDGIVGDGVFIWPTTEHWLSGFDYNPAANHPAIDIAGDTGNPVWAADDGVVVYAGWSYSGYGNLIVLDHGNGWQSLYAHLNDIYVGCGESVYQGAAIGTLGNTGQSSGSHLHFELMYGTAKVNPWNFLP